MRTPFNTCWSLLKVFLTRYWSPGPRDDPLPDMKYIVYGFSYIQDMVEHAIIREQTGDSLDEDIGILVQQFPYPCYIYDKFTMAISRSLPLFMILSWIYTVSMVVKGIVYEKEQRLKEVMKTMGLSNAVHWCAWFISCILMMLVSIFLLLIVLKVSLTPFPSPRPRLMFSLSMAGGPCSRTLRPFGHLCVPAGVQRGDPDAVFPVQRVLQQG